MDGADRKRRWDEPADDTTATSKANDAAAAAAGIAAKIAASLRPGGAGNELVKREGFDEGFVKDIEINDLRNRYVLTKGSTQKQVSYHSFCISGWKKCRSSIELIPAYRLERRQERASPRKASGSPIEPNSNRAKHHSTSISSLHPKSSSTQLQRRSMNSSIRNSDR